MPRLYEQETKILGEDVLPSQVKIFLDQTEDGRLYTGIRAGHHYVEIPVYSKQFAFDGYVAYFIAYERFLKPWKS